MGSISFRKKFSRMVIKLIVLILIPYIITMVEKSKAGTPATVSGQVSGKISVNVTNTGKYVILPDSGKEDVNLFIAQVLADRLDISRNTEVLKAESVMLRTDIFRMMGDNNSISVENLGFEYIKKNNISDDDYNLVSSAVTATDNKVIKYNGRLIEARSMEVSNGTTLDGEKYLGSDYGYLKEIDTSGDIQSEKYLKVAVISCKDFAKKIGINSDKPLEQIQIVSKSTSGYVMKIQVGNTVMSGIQFAQKAEIPSPSFQLEDYDGKIKITSKGCGDGYGVSLYSAQIFAEDGMNYKDILEKFYNEIDLD